MQDGVSVLAGLLLVSAMMAAILTIAWSTMGRARHAATWALAFAVAAVEWAINLGMVLVEGLYAPASLHPLTRTVVALLAVVVIALLAAGFGQRNHAKTPPLWLLLATGAAFALIVFATAWPHVGMRRAIPHLFAAIVLATASADVARGHRPSVAERSVIVMLWLFALFGAIVGALSLAAGADGTALGGLDRSALLLGMPPVFVGVGLFLVFLLAADLAERMRLLAARDPLTGILNRRGFDEAAERAMANALRHAVPLSIALADLDRFKTVNDMHGHPVGDALLRQFADSVGDAIRQGDLIGRLGGEEFVLLLVNTPGEAAVTVIDRLRRDVATLHLPTAPPMTVTTSFGVAELQPGDTLASLLARADRALYRSKVAGRDRVSFADVESMATV